MGVRVRPSGRITDCTGALLIRTTLIGSQYIRRCFDRFLSGR